MFACFSDPISKRSVFLPDRSLVRFPFPTPPLRFFLTSSLVQPPYVCFRPLLSAPGAGLCPGRDGIMERASREREEVGNTWEGPERHLQYIFFLFLFFFSGSSSFFSFAFSSFSSLLLFHPSYFIFQRCQPISPKGESCCGCHRFSRRSCLLHSLTSSIAVVYMLYVHRSASCSW